MPAPRPSALLLGVAVLVLAFLAAPMLAALWLSFSPTELLSFPPRGFSLRWYACLLYTSPSPRDGLLSRMPSSA